MIAPASLYIQSSRGEHAEADVNPQLSVAYHGMFQNLTSYFKSLAPDVDVALMELRSVKTFDVRAETLHIGGRTTIIYDQFTGQAFNALNRLMLGRAELPAVDMYLLKLFASVLLSAGNPRKALPYSILYRQLRESGVELPTVRSGLKAHFVFFQEAFVIAHEMAHATIRVSDAARSLLQENYLRSLRMGVEYRLWRVSHLTESEMQEREQSIDEEFFSDWRRAFHKAYGRSPTAEEERIGPKPKKRGIDENKYALITVESDPGLLEECLCDAVAADAAAQMYPLIGSSPIVGLIGSFVGMHYLRLLRSFNITSSTSDVPADKEDELKPRPHMARFLAFRLTAFAGLNRRLDDLPNYADEDDTSIDDLMAMVDTLDDFNQRLAGFNRLYWEVVGDYHGDFFHRRADMLVDRLLETDDYHHLASLSSPELGKLVRYFASE